VSWLPVKSAAPLYVAVIANKAMGSAAVEKVATVPSSGTVPSHIPVAVNVTVPVACAAVEEVTVAVNLTFCPTWRDRPRT
jgi:hypothetical protein